MFGRISVEQRVALMLHCQRSGVENELSSRPMSCSDGSGLWPSPLERQIVYQKTAPISCDDFRMIFQTTPGPRSNRPHPNRFQLYKTFISSNMRGCGTRSREAGAGATTNRSCSTRDSTGTGIQRGLVPNENPPNVPKTAPK